MIFNTFIYDTRIYDYSKFIELIRDFRTFVEVVEYLQAAVSNNIIKTEVVVMCE